VGAGADQPPATAADRLSAIREAGLLRRLRRVESRQGPYVDIEDQRALLLCGNNYLGLAEHPIVLAAAAEALERWGAGAGASRLVSGNMDPHEQLERELAGFLGRPTSLLFGSGYLANTGAVAALAGRGEVVFSDALNHASIIDGCRLSGAARFVYRHRDVEHLAWGMKRAAGRPALIVTDGLFSMDGDLAPLGWLVELARKHGARLMVDDAHALGAIGPGGRGTAAELGLVEEIDVLVGTLGKALGSYGAFVSTGAELRELLVNTARPLIFSTALPPACAAAAGAALEILVAEPERVERLAANAAALRQGFAAEGLEVGESAAQIIPVLVGDAERAVAASRRALDRGVYAQAIRPPTVPDGTSRIRLTVMATHDESDLRAAATTIADAVRAVAVDGDWALPELETTLPRIEVPELDETPVIRRGAGAGPDGDGEIRVARVQPAHAASPSEGARPTEDARPH
jgi:8-amino-7-oxononanoate synthase